MRVSFISTYPPTECGIATYTRDLRTALDARRHETSVIAQVGAAGENVFPTYVANRPYVDDLFDVATRMTPDVVHIQHEYGLFGPYHGAAIVDLMIRFRMAEVPVVTTLHTVYEMLTPPQRIILDEVARHGAGIVVHEDYQRQTLLRELGDSNPGLADRVHVIEHGVRELAPIEDAKAKLSLEGRKVVMLCGYFRPTKRFDRVIAMLPRLIEADDDITLVLAGKVRGVEAQDYRDKLLKQIADLGVSDKHVRIFRGQFPQHTFDTTLSAADVICLPYTAGAQSGMLCQCLALGRPVVTSDLAAFEQVFDRAGGGIACEDDEAMFQGILKALHDDAWRKETTARAARYIAEHSGWSQIAKAHEAVYDAATGEADQPGEYVYFPEDEADETAAAPKAAESRPPSSLEPSAAGGESDEGFDDFDELNFDAPERRRAAHLAPAADRRRAGHLAGSGVAVQPGVPGAGGVQPGRVPLR